jgi:ATP-dependent Clp protease adaptor protein ClpS
MAASTETLDLPSTATDSAESLDTPWIVTLFDDPVNLMDYVTMVIMRLFGYPRQQAEIMMKTVHTKGKCVVWTGERERAELYVQQLHGHQLKATLSRAD